MASNKATGNGKTDGAKAEKPLSVEQLLKVEKEARAAWYAHFKGSAPVKPYSTEASASLRTLEKAKSALVAATGEPNFKAAAKKIGYSPQYAPRTRKPAATAAKA